MQENYQRKTGCEKTTPNIKNNQVIVTAIMNVATYLFVVNDNVSACLVYTTFITWYFTSAPLNYKKLPISSQAKLFKLNEPCEDKFNDTMKTQYFTEETGNEKPINL